MIVYSRSKLANVLFTQRLARDLAGTGVTAFAVHPGSVNTNFGGEGDTKGWLRPIFKSVVGASIDAEHGARAVVHAAIRPGIEGTSGSYYQSRWIGNWGPVKAVRPSRAARNSAYADHLWDLSERLTT